VANRGEIAIRVIRAARELGIRTVAIYSDVDRHSAHVVLADEAYRIGRPPASKSYLLGSAIVDLAKRHEVDAIHPGYGFLSEREEFAQAVEDAGIIFVGPTPATIGAMGDKAEARRLISRAGVDVVPGSNGPVGTVDAAVREAAEIGYPVLLKAVSGGGGKGMRVVESPQELSRAFRAARREAEAAFGDGTIYVERYLARPRHVEVQILGDTHGNIVHLGERECSIQRRHQKLVEETPSPGMTPEQRDKLVQAALLAAGATAYRGAGTVEFLFDQEEFYFLEMNTRIQVEHPVTEMVTGVDLVQAQLRIAMGEKIPFNQRELRHFGHALECRITAEDPDFLPSTGRITHLTIPGGAGVRWDSGVQAGQEVTLHYDSLLGKLIVHAPTREEAIYRMQGALGELVVAGIETSIPFHRRLLADPNFRFGELSTHFLAENPHLTSSQHSKNANELAAMAASLLEVERAASGAYIRTAVETPIGWAKPY